MAFIQPATVARISYSLRPFVIGFLVLVCLVPLQMVKGVINDRIGNHHVALEGITNSWARSQTLFGPVLIVPLSEIKTTDHFNPETQKTTVTRHTVNSTDFFIADDLKIDVEWTTEERARGIHRVPVYTAKLHLTGRLDGMAKKIADYKARGMTVGSPYLSVIVNDIRGIGGRPLVRLDGKELGIEPGSRIPSWSGGFHVPLDVAAITKDSLPIDIRFDLKGSENFHVVPTGGVVEMNGKANWAHPSFNGNFLPDSKTITDSDFSASWKAGLLATNIVELAEPCIGGDSNACSVLMGNTFGVSFFQPVDIYTQSLRAAKYGVLFVVLTFAVFYITEILQGTRVYTMQLLLVGAALAIFYLLLVSLSEFIGFEGAYLVASLAVTALLTYYTSFMLKSRKGGLMIGGIVALLYTVLYFNLSSEDYALLIGSVLLFLVLTVIMVITRNVDWNARRKGAEEIA